MAAFLYTKPPEYICRPPDHLYYVDKHQLIHIHQYIIMKFVCQLVHLSDQAIDVILPVSMVTAFNKVCSLLSISTASIAQFEWPQEIIGFLEMLSNGEDLVDKILHTDDAILAKALLNDGIVSKGRPSLFNFAKSSFVDQFSHTLQIRISKVKLKNTTDKIYTSPYLVTK